MTPVEATATSPDRQIPSASAADSCIFCASSKPRCSGRGIGVAAVGDHGPNLAPDSTASRVTASGAPLKALRVYTPTETHGPAPENSRPRSRPLALPHTARGPARHEAFRPPLRTARNHLERRFYAKC